MSVLEVVFEVPHFIETGLLSGALQRVGGVIVHSGSKQVVAWLRDGSLSDNPVTDTSGVLAKILSSTKISQTFNPVAHQVANLINLTAAGQVVNLAVSTITLYTVTQRLDSLTRKVDALGTVIREEFNRNRDLKFSLALEQAREGIESGQASRREHALNRARDGLHAAMKDFLDDFDRVIQTDNPETKLTLAQQYLLRAVYAQISRVRCYMVAQDDHYAKDLLSREMPHFKTRTRKFVEGCLGEYPAVFFHKDVPSEDLKRFLQIQRWLFEDDITRSKNDADILLEIIEKFRVDFWNPAVERNIAINADLVASILERFTNQVKPTLGARLANLQERLMYAESAIENYERLLGFELELRSMSLSFDEWDKLVDDATLQERGIGLIIDLETMQDWGKQN